MSATALVWILLAVLLLLLSFTRPVWAVGFYMQTVFAAPHLWWWGRDIPQARYSLWAGVVLLLAVAFNRAQSLDENTRERTIVQVAAIAMVLNATFVHFFLATRPQISIDTYVELLKYVLLFFIMGASIRNRKDFRFALVAIALGATYIGFEVTINDRGDFSGSRLEGVGAPAAQNANSLADLMLISLPLAGSLFLYQSPVAKVMALVGAPLILNVLLLCNSRGAFLGLFGAAMSFLLVAKGPTRKKALGTLALGAVVLYFLLGDPEIFSRFTSTFVGSEERDNSAASRLDFWRAGLLMLADYPLGDGGGAFKFVHGANYLSVATGDDDPESRSLHNGYLTEATDWGVQGLILKLLFVGGALLAAYRTTNRARLEGRIDDSLIGICVIVTGAALMIHCLFGSFLSNEWTYWITAILVRYSHLYSEKEKAAETEEVAAAA
jgi:O-antigen ligase/polysaccharide polymerase Wzy-like membrane protein